MESRERCVRKRMYESVHIPDRWGKSIMTFAGMNCALCSCFYGLVPKGVRDAESRALLAFSVPKSSRTEDKVHFLNGQLADREVIS